MNREDAYASMVRGPTKNEQANFNANATSSLSSELPSTKWTEKDWDDLVKRSKKYAYVRPSRDVLEDAAIYLVFCYVGVTFDHELINVAINVLLSASVLDLETNYAVGTVPIPNKDFRREFQGKEIPEKYNVIESPTNTRDSQTISTKGEVVKIPLRNNAAAAVTLLDAVRKLTSEDPEEFEVAMKAASYLLFLYLKCMRMQKKELEPVLLHMYKTISKTTMSMLGYSLEPPLPSATFIKRWLLCFSAESEMYKNLIARPIVNSIIIRKQNAQHPLLGFLKAGCVLTLGENGLGAISFLYKAWKALALTTSEDQKRLLVMMCNDYTGASAQLIYSYLNSKNAEGWNFSRLFSNTANSDLSTKRNVHFTMVCAYIAFGDVNADMMAGVRQFEGYESNAEICQELAEAIRSVMGRTSAQTAWGPLARVVCDELGERRRRKTEKKTSKKKKPKKPETESEAETEEESVESSDDEFGEAS